MNIKILIQQRYFNLHIGGLLASQCMRLQTYRTLDNSINSTGISIRSLVTRNYIGGVMNRVLAPSAVYRGLEPWSVQIYFYSAKHAALRSKSKDWLARNQNNVLKWCDRYSAEYYFSERAL